MTDQSTNTDESTTTPTPLVYTAPAQNQSQQGTQDNDKKKAADEEKERQRRQQMFDNLSPGQKLILSILMFFFGRFMNSEDEEQANGGHPDQDKRFQDINKMFSDILGMDDKQYTQFKRDMHQPGVDWRKEIDSSHVDFKKADDFTRNPPKGLLDLISRHESGGDYNVVYGGKHVDLTNMTINQVLDWQKNYVRSGSASSAAGRYQFLSSTLEGLKKEMHLSGNEKFDEAMQDKLATRLLERRGLSDFMSGKISQDKFMKNLSMEWASLPKDGSGRSYYAGDGLNRALTSPAVVQNLLAEVKAQGSTTVTASNFNNAATGSKTTLASNTPEKTPGGPAPSPKNA